MASELLKLGTSALLGNQSHLQTVSNNIANMDTPGYSRQRTEFQSYVEWGLGRAQTVRLFDKFAIDQLRRDSASLGYAEKYRDNATIMDNLFADDQSSIAKGLDDVFARINEAAEEPSAITPRQLFISDSEAMVARMQGMSERVLEQEDVVNEEIELTISETNSLLNSLYELNDKIVQASAGDGNEPTPNLIDERNEVIRQLSEKVGVNAVEKENNAIEIHAPNGQPLVIDGAVFNMRAVQGDPDPSRYAVEVYSVNNEFNDSNVTTLSDSGLDGELGALFDYRREVLDETINSLGQMAIAFADAMNEQNAKGVDLEGNLGGDVFNIPSTKALGYQDNSSANHDIEVNIEAGYGDQVTNFDYHIEFTSATQYTIQPMQDGELVGTVTGPIDYTIDNDGDGLNGNAEGLPDGLILDLTPDTAFAAGDQFLVRPTRLAGLEIEMNLNRPEQLALAGPITVSNPIENLGNGRIVIEDVTNTGTTNANDSGFDATPGLDSTAPAQIIYNNTGTNGYDVYDSSGTLIGTVTSGDNIMQQLRDNGVYPTPTYADDYPGYEVSVEGSPQTGDEFDIAFNSDGLNDNFNGLKLAELQSEDTMRRNVLTTGSNSLTFAEAYSNLIGGIGDTANRANIDYESASILHAQSEQRVADESGVNLDEEAADLVRYEQAYNASARIITVAQTTFDAILAAVR